MGLLLTIAFFLILIVGAVSEKIKKSEERNKERYRGLEERIEELEQQQRSDKNE